VGTTEIILVDSEDGLAKTVAKVVSRIKGCRLAQVVGVEAAVFRAERNHVGLVLAYLAGEDGADGLARLVRGLAHRRPRIPTIVLSEAGEPEWRLKMLQLGAVECLPRPVDTARLAFLVDLLTIRARYEEPDTSRVGFSEHQSPDSCVDGFHFTSGPMQRLLGQLSAVAPLETTVLLTGETGSGKTHLARVIHRLSPRQDRPFVVVHCGSLTPTLLQSELFGHVRGSFTGAECNYAGKFAEAADGTILLDEVDCIPLESQAKLLRVMDDRVYEPVGSSRPQPLRARMVVASNQPLEGLVAAGQFRADLYYRLNVVSFVLPPLRDRREAIMPLAEQFLASFAARAPRKVRGFAPGAVLAIQGYDWPGNIRELRNAIERAVALGSGEQVHLADLPAAVQGSWRPFGPEWPDHAFESGSREGRPGSNGLALGREEGERKRLLETLQRHNNNRTTAAAELGISRVTLYKKMHQHGLL
jgi:DNA-binding NtrC family response regulator